MHEVILQNEGWKEKKGSDFYTSFSPTKEKYPHKSSSSIWKENWPGSCWEAFSRFPQQQAGEGTDSMTHIHRLFSGEGKPKHINMGDYNLHLQSPPFPLASPPSSNYHQTATHQECHLQLSGRERTNYNKHAYNVWKPFNVVKAFFLFFFPKYIHDFPRSVTLHKQYVASGLPPFLNAVNYIFYPTLYM